MKLVIISVPSIVNDAEINEAASAFAGHLNIEGLKCNILNENEITIENPVKTVQSTIEKIVKDCYNDNPFITYANFWNNISKGRITKDELVLITKPSNRRFTQTILQQKGLTGFSTMFDDAVKSM